MKTDKELAEKLGALRERISKPEFHDILKDLQAFTSMSKKEILFRILRKQRNKYGARGWYDDEFDWHSPDSDEELSWFYQSAQSYIFSNARRPHWDALKFIDKDSGPVLDYGCGIGQNVVELSERDVEVHYMELGSLQRDFVRFRLCIKDLVSDTMCIDPFYRGELNTIRCIDKIYGTIILQHVLEHIPNYRKVLRYLIKHLKPGGMIIEHSPFKTYMKRFSKGPKMHVKEIHPMNLIMIEGQMELHWQSEIKPHMYPRVWRKREWENSTK